MRQTTAWPYLQLMRPANLLTAAADILAGFAAAQVIGRRDTANLAALPWLLVATIGLYGGGVVLNDVFDRALDSVERPERPLPSGRASVRGAAALGVSLLVPGIGAAAMASPPSGALALLIALCAVLYDSWGKHRPLLAPLNMGACRGLNLLLGVSAAPALVSQRWYLAFIPIAYIAAITAVSAGEVHGGRRATGRLALGLQAGVLLALLTMTRGAPIPFLSLLPFMALLTWRVLPPFWRAAADPQPNRIRTAVRAGVLSLIVLDASIAALYAGPLYGLIVLALLPAAARLARLFAVT
jgi:4-hydroxybenzoate polyprenyltransferase